MYLGVFIRRIPVVFRRDRSDYKRGGGVLKILHLRSTLEYKSGRIGTPMLKIFG